MQLSESQRTEFQRTESQHSEAQRGSSASPPPRSKRRHQRGLLLVGLYKVCESALTGALGAGALHLVHRDVGNVLMQLVDALRIDPASRLVATLMDKADLIGGHQLRQFSMVMFAYAALHLIEGAGLMLEKIWAEYFTVVLTAMGLPWEAYELVKGFEWFKVGLMLVNLAVLVYLLWLLKRKKEHEAKLT